MLFVFAGMIIASVSRQLLVTAVGSGLSFTTIRASRKFSVMVRMTRPLPFGPGKIHRHAQLAQAYTIFLPFLNQ